MLNNISVDYIRRFKNATYLQKEKYFKRSAFLFGMMFAFGK